MHIDPIEKKPFFHVLPGTASLSLATVGCNFECHFCQNWEIAQARPEQVRSSSRSPDELAAIAVREKTPTIACTYTEPVVWAEYAYDIAAASRLKGVRTVMVSNGYVEEEPLNDGEQKIRDLASFVKNELGPEVPVHLTRFPSLLPADEPSFHTGADSRARAPHRHRGGPLPRLRPRPAGDLVVGSACIGRRVLIRCGAPARREPATGPGARIRSARLRSGRRRG